MKRPTQLERARELVRDVESGVTAPLRRSDLLHAARKIDDLVAGEPPDALVHVPVATLKAYREGARLALLDELEAGGHVVLGVDGKLLQVVCPHDWRPAETVAGMVLCPKCGAAQSRAA